MAIEKLATKYRDFQNEFGSTAGKDFEIEICELFAQDFTKIANGKTLVLGLSGLENQLSEVK